MACENFLTNHKICPWVWWSVSLNFFAGKCLLVIYWYYAEQFEISIYRKATTWKFINWYRITRVWWGKIPLFGHFFATPNSPILGCNWRQKVCLKQARDIFWNKQGIFCSVVSVSSFDLYSPFSIISCTDTMTNNQWLFVLFTVHARILLLPVSLLSLRFYEAKAWILCFGDVSTLRGFFQPSLVRSTLLH